MKPYELPKNLKFQRYYNSKGKVIPIHHAFKTVELSSFSRISAVVLPVLFLAIFWVLLPFIFDFWGSIFEFWMQHIYQGGVGYEPRSILGQQFYFPYPALDAEAPTQYAIWMNLIICIVAFIISFLTFKQAIPITYLLRTLLVLQASASVDRLLSPDFFPYTLKLYLLDAETLCIYMLMVLPPLLGMVYYVFDFSLGRKFLLTFMILGYYLFFIPCQYMLHAYLIHEYSLLMLPIMYIFFGVVLDVLTFVSIYSFGMSWKSRTAAVQGRGV